MHQQSSRFLTAIDLAGTFLFALEGAMTAMAARLDLLGILVLAFATALGGGIIRDILLGATPPAAFLTWYYPTVALGGGTIAFVGHGLVGDLPTEPITVLDAAGLALFAVAGTGKALSRGMPAISAIMLGATTAVGGGTVRDMLLAHIPAILRVDVYATAALAGSAMMVALRRAGLPAPSAGLLGGIACFGVRMLAVRLHWHLPTGIGPG